MALAGIFYITASIIHIWTVIIAFQQSGFIAAIISLILPFLSEVYWMFKMWGENDLYAWLALIHIIFSILFGIGRNNSQQY